MLAKGSGCDEYFVGNWQGGLGNIIHPSNNYENCIRHIHFCPVFAFMLITARTKRFYLLHRQMEKFANLVYRRL